MLLSARLYFIIIRPSVCHLQQFEKFRFSVGQDICEELQAFTAKTKRE